MIKNLLFFVSVLFCIHTVYASEQKLDPSTPENKEIKQEQTISDNKDKDTEVASKNEDNNKEQKNKTKPKEEASKITEEELSKIIIIIINKCATTANNKIEELQRNQYTEEKKQKATEATNTLWQISFIKAFIHILEDNLKNMVEVKFMNLEELARIAVKVRKHAYEYSRNKDEVKKEEAAKKDEINKLSFESLLKDQLEIQKKEHNTKNPDKEFNEKPLAEGGNFDLNKAYKTIIKLSTEVNLAATTLISCYDLFPKILCDCTAGLLDKFTGFR